MTETYYGEFYGFRSAPFHITPDPSVLFPTATHQAALGAIEYCIAAGKGFVVVSGQVGVGKTTVLRCCLDRLDSSKTKIIYLYNPAMTTVELYNTILDELDPSLRPSINAADTSRTLQRTLLETHRAGKQVILAVDEAQNMPEQTLESLRILSNLETAKTKLLQIILVGQPELDVKLKKHSLRQLSQRVAVRARIKRLTFRQSCRYIQHRTRCAGRSAARSLFTLPAQWYIALVARGTPRTINICCDNALINGYGHSAERISLPIALEACRSLEYRVPIRRPAALAAALLLLACAFFYRDALLDGVDAMRARLGAPQTVRQIALTAQSPHLNTPPAADPEPVSLQARNQQTSLEELPQPQATSSTTQGSARPPTETPAPHLKWLVHKGDSVYKACLETYGSCDRHTLRSVLADNPQVGADAMIYQGDVLIMPESIGVLHAKPQ